MKTTHGCDAYDKFLGRGHVHCQADVAVLPPFGTDIAPRPCDEILLIDQEGPGDDEFTVKLEFGARCSDCKATICTSHLKTGPDDQLVRCFDCYSARSRALQDECEISMTLVRAAREVDAFIERLNQETDPERIRAAVKELDDLDKVMDRAHCAMLTRCAGLPMRGAA